MAKKYEKPKMVPVPSHSIIPERDIDKSPILECQHLGIDFGGLRAVDDFNLTIGRTEIAGLIGPNGAGKTTVFNLLTKVYQPTRGTIMLDGIDTAGKTTAQINRMGIARTFQNIRLFRQMSVIDNVKAAFSKDIKYRMGAALFRTPGYWKAEAAMEQKALDLLDIFHLKEYAEQPASSLPYGQQRKLEIARALATDMKVLLLDEPAAGMNPTETAELVECISIVRERFGIAILLIEHDMSLVMKLCERITVIDYGQTIAEGGPEEIANNPRVIAAYLGENDEEEGENLA